eukprot:TRINITY_DN2999_c0_g1_i1.p1 TRINITY_DN2999_c0_g1~~TRINITY_DN2999_c0_g1_i1.p1  ORF type:complete len:329 (+),score=59.48 TRINITY_DN2999_c0_g1_i1:379-1365(+)
MLKKQKLIALFAFLVVGVYFFVQSQIPNHENQIQSLERQVRELQKMVSEDNTPMCVLPVTEEKPPAFVTMVSSDFWKQGLVLLQTARDQGVTHPFVVMVVDQNNLSPGDPNFSHLPQEAVDAFTRLNGELRYIEPVPVPEHAKFDNPRWALAWNKLRAFTFTEYGRLVFLDSDMMIMKDVSEMVTFPDFSTAPGQSEPCETHHGINGGVLIFTPNMTLFDELIEFSKLREQSWRQAEQQLLGYFYYKRYKHNFHLISGLYNISMRSCMCLTPVVLRDHVKIIHFYSGRKPWEHTVEHWKNPNFNLEHECHATLALEWYSILDRALMAH